MIKMVGSERKRAANKQNAQRSTGPRTDMGKRCASRNALRHGLAAAIKEPPFLLEIERLAEALLGGGPSPIARQCTREVAAAHVDLVRVRMARVKALARLVQAIPHQDHHPDCMPNRDTIAFTLGDLNILADLKKLDRYERNALLRKRRAIEQFLNLRLVSCKTKPKPSWQQSTPLRGHRIQRFIDKGKSYPTLAQILDSVVGFTNATGPVRIERKIEPKQIATIVVGPR